MQIEEALERYQLATRALGYSFRTISHVVGCVQAFGAFLQNKQRVEDIGAEDYRRYLAELRGQPAWRGLPQQQQRVLSATSVNTYARAIRSFWGWLRREGIIGDNPLELVKAPKKPRTLPSVYSEDQLRTIFNAFPKVAREKTILEILLDSGIRLSELATLQAGDVDLTAGRIKVTGKGSKQRYAYISKRTLDTIQKYIKQVRPESKGESNLLLAANGHPLGAKRIQKILKNMGKKAGINETLSAHRLRHTYATLSLKYGINMEYLKTTMGHADIKNTSESYVHADEADIAAAHKKTSPIANLLPTENAAITADISLPVKAQCKIQPSVPVETRKDAPMPAPGILQSKISVTMRPACNPLLSVIDPLAYAPFAIPIENDQIKIECLHVYTTDARVPFHVMLFAGNTPQAPDDWEREDLIRSEMTRQRVFEFSPGRPLPYTDYDELKRLHGGICIGQRPIRRDRNYSRNPETALAYHEAPVSFKISVQYRLGRLGESAPDPT